MWGTGTPCASASDRTAASAVIGLSSISAVGRIVATSDRVRPGPSAAKATLVRRAPADEARRPSR
jgi:hypothetical protein